MKTFLNSKMRQLCSKRSLKKFGRSLETLIPRKGYKIESKGGPETKLDPEMTFRILISGPSSYKNPGSAPEDVFDE